MKTTKGYNFPALMYLLELKTQAHAAKEAYHHLGRGLIGRRNGATDAEIESRISPIETTIYCTALVSSIAMIGKILDPGSRSPMRVKQRAEKLRFLLGECDFPSLFDRKARNANEHLDERFDKYLHGFTSGSMNLGISLTENPPKPGTFTPRRLDPVTMELTIAGDTLDLPACILEIDRLESSIETAFTRLTEERHELWTD